MTEEKPLYAIADFQFEQIHRDAIDTLRAHLSKTKIPSDFKKWKKHVDATLEILLKQQKTRQEFMIEYAREMNELAKIRDINHGTSRLQTVPYTTGKEKERECIQQEEKKRRRKRKKKEK